MNDTADTGRETDTGMKECDVPIVSASSLAGETGGFSCSTGFANFGLSITLAAFFIISSRRLAW